MPNSTIAYGGCVFSTAFAIEWMTKSEFNLGCAVPSSYRLILIQPVILM